MAATSIEWTRSDDGTAGVVWNPSTGCDRLSPGCDNCYALTMAKRLKGMGQAKYQTDGDPRTSGPGFGLAVHEDALTIPVGWRKPRRIFVNSMSDLFHADVPVEFIAKVFAVMAATPRHTYQLLTKRHGRMRSVLNDPKFRQSVQRRIPYAGGNPYAHKHYKLWPLPNVWLGVSVEDQQWADIRIPALLDTPAAVRWISAEPLLGPVDLHNCDGVDAIEKDWIGGPGGGSGAPHPFLRWVVAGGESGPDARPMHPDWARSLRDQCTAAGVPFFFKQHGAWAPVGPLYGDSEETDDAHMDAVQLEVEEKREVVQLETTGHIAQGYQPTDPRTWLMARVGKNAAGRELDGRTWDQYPEEVSR